MSCKHYLYLLHPSHRHFVKSDKHNNCVLCLSENEGPMTQEQIGNYLGITKMAISQIEARALKKLKKKMINFFVENPLQN